jgi:hypothetical protein
MSAATILIFSLIFLLGAAIVLIIILFDALGTEAKAQPLIVWKKRDNSALQVIEQIISENKNTTVGAVLFALNAKHQSPFAFMADSDEELTAKLNALRDEVNAK